MATVALDALFDYMSIRQYMVVVNVREAGITIRKAMQKIVPLDERQVHTYDCNTLIGMLDEASAKPEM